MTIKREVRLCDFETWGGAFERYGQLTCDELASLEDLYPEGIDETMLNDLFWFEFPWLCDLVGLEVNEETDEVIRR